MCVALHLEWSHRWSSASISVLGRGVPLLSSALTLRSKESSKIEKYALKKTIERAQGSHLESCFSSFSGHASWALSCCNSLPGTVLGRGQAGHRSKRQSETEELP